MDLITDYCEICGKRQATDTHHLISGVSGRAICDMIGGELLIRVCRNCHDDIHKSNTAAKLSKMLGQALYERTNSRKEFVKLFGVNYLRSENET